MMLVCAHVGSREAKKISRRTVSELFHVRKDPLEIDDLDVRAFARFLFPTSNLERDMPTADPVAGYGIA